MFDAERLLGKLINETIGRSTTTGNIASESGGIMDALTSSGGLMTAIGLGVGAFEILKQQKEKAAATQSAPPPPPGTPGTAPTPPPPPGDQAAAPPPLGTASAPPALGGSPVVKQPAQNLALRMIRVMIAAAHADGILDVAEEKAILDKMRGADLSGEEKMFILDELHHPKTLAELADGITDPATAKTMYMLAVSAIEIDTEAERTWLNELGSSLSLSPQIMQFIEDQAMK
jgi:uncharacterized membrane protein YebE (DUF533 family)